MANDIICEISSENELICEMSSAGEIVVEINAMTYWMPNEELALKADKTYVDNQDAALTAQLAQKTSEINTLRNTKVGDGVLAEMGDLSQAVKEGMTGGSVAVVGEGAVGEVNLANDLSTKLATTYLHRNVSFLASLNEPRNVHYDGDMKKYTIPAGSRIVYGKSSYSFPETLNIIDDNATSALFLVFSLDTKAVYLKPLTSGLTESELLMTTIRRYDLEKKIKCEGNVPVEGDVISDMEVSERLMYALINGGLDVERVDYSTIKIDVTSELFLYALKTGNASNKRIIFNSLATASATGRTLPILETGTRLENGNVSFVMGSDTVLVYTYGDNTIRLKSSFTSLKKEDVLLAYSVYGELTGGLFMELFDHLKIKELEISLQTIENNISSGELINDVFSRNKDVEHIINAAADHNRNLAYDHLLTMIVGTDFHGDHTRLSNMIEYGNKSPVIDAILDLGDIMGGHFNDNDGTPYSNTIQKSTKPYLMALGNHDAGNTALVGQSTTPLNMYNKFIAPNENLMALDYTIGVGETYYYKDFADKKIRIITLNPCDLPDENDGTTFTISRTVLGFSQTQIDWFINTLNSTPGDYHVLIAAHDMIESRIIETEHVFTNPNRILTPKQVNHGTVISDIINAWKNGLTLSKTYPFTVTTVEASSVSATADFTGKSGIFIGYITGDRHVDAVYHLENYPDQRGITFDTSNYSSISQRYISDLPRSEGNKSEDILTIMSFDVDRRVVNLVRIGANVTRFMKERTFSTFEY